MSATEHAEQADVADLAKFGYRQELRRILGVYSSFAVAFSYISPSTGIFTLFILGISLAGPAFFWSWPIVVIGQLLIALNFAGDPRRIVLPQFPPGRIEVSTDAGRKPGPVVLAALDLGSVEGLIVALQ